MTNASDVIFGFEFQYNAAIYIMLQLKDVAKSVRVEGKTQDIEIYLKDNQVVFGQAKAVVESNDYRNLNDKLESALEGLDKATISNNVISSIYITNSPNPFNNQKLINEFLDVKRLDYKNLPDFCKEKIQKIVKKKKLTHLNLSTLKVWTLPFFGDDDDNRYATILRLVGDFLVEIEAPESLRTKLLDAWKLTFSQNSSKKDMRIVIKKEDMIWPLIVLVIENSRHQNIVEFEQYDPGIVKTVEERFATFISDRTNRFEFTTKVITSFDEYCLQANSTNRETYEKFINNEWEMFIDEFWGVITDSEIEKVLIQVIIRNILFNRNQIRTIKRNTSL